ncbi:hypothetical protein LHY41_004714 [Salmonella enterica]|nr:hypothetical protein [Salmonella enterica]
MPELDLKHSIAGAPHETDSTQRNAHAQSLGCECEYCGYPSAHNTAILRDSNPLNSDDSNLSVVDPFCRAWRELNTLTADNAVIIMLPGLSSEDINHFQRTLYVALNCNDEQTRQDARQLLEWLTEHNALAEKRFDTSHPGAFAQALHRTAPSQRNETRIAWRHIAPVLNPARLPAPTDLTPLESTPDWWPLMYQHYRTQGGA